MTEHTDSLAARGRRAGTTPARGELEDLAHKLAALSGHHPELARRAERLAERIARQRFHIAVVGEFKRGKSTLVNALIGQPLLPMGVVPLTTVATEVHFGSVGLVPAGPSPRGENGCGPARRRRDFFGP